MIKPYRTAQILAQELLVQAAENEPQITADLQKITSEVSAKIVGLENRFKSVKSLTDKMFFTATLNAEPLNKVAEDINDALRYTFILPFENYSEKYKQIIKMLSEFNYFIPKKRIWNAWKTAGKSFDKGYRGINITVISSHSQIFELQFHTAESYKLKMETHSLYKELKTKEISEKRLSEIIKTLRKKAENVRKPKEV